MVLRHFFALLGGAWLAFTSLVSAQDEQPPVVPFVHPVVKQVPRHIDLTGHIDAPRVDLRARVTGYLEKIHIEEGAEVKPGDLLFEIDSRPYRIEVERTEAQLRAGEARLRRVDVDFARMKTLQMKGAGSIQDVNRLAAERTEAEAELAAFKAALQLARLNLDYTRIMAPIAGRIGRRMLDVGNLVKADETQLGVLVGKPNRVLFWVTEPSAIALRRAAQKMGKGLDRASLPVAVALADEPNFPHKALLDFVDATTSGDRPRLLLGASLTNPDPLMAPGTAVRVRLLAGETEPLLSIPRAALEPGPGFGQSAESVLVLDAENRVQRKRIVLRSRGREDHVLVENGLTEKDRIVPANRNLQVGMLVKPVLDESNQR